MSEVAATAPKKGNLGTRVSAGIVLGVAGAVIVTFGQLPFLALLLWITYQATQEYYGFITSSGISKGMTPPPPLVSSMTTVLCMGICMLAYTYKKRSGTVLAVASFILLVLEVLAIRRPKFSQLASTTFGLFYCGQC